MKQDKMHQVFNSDDYKEDVAVGGIRVYLPSVLVVNFVLSKPVLPNNYFEIII